MPRSNIWGPAPLWMPADLVLSVRLERNAGRACLNAARIISRSAWGGASGPAAAKLGEARACFVRAAQCVHRARSRSVRAALALEILKLAERSHE